MLVTPILETIILLTLIFSFFSFLLLVLVRRAYCEEAELIGELIAQEKNLSDNILMLHKKIYDLDKDLEELARENEIIREEIKTLSDRMENLQAHISDRSRI